MKWVKCSSWADLPIGTILVKINNERKPYNVANVSVNAQGCRMVIVGNHFSWDMGEVIAYSHFKPFEE